MGDIPQFFVVAFSRTEAEDIRIEAVMKASSKSHAAMMASHLANWTQGVVAYARLTKHGAEGGERLEILAKFGDPLPADSSFWTIGQSRDRASTRGNSLQVLSLWAWLRAGLNARLLWQDVVIPRASALLVVAALIVSGGSLVALAGANRVARLVEIARPACLHLGIQNKDLRRIVRHALRAGSSTKDVVYAITSACQAISQEL
jgi:hypothetical protein